MIPVQQTNKIMVRITNLGDHFDSESQEISVIDLNQLGEILVKENNLEGKATFTFEETNLSGNKLKKEIDEERLQWLKETTQSY